MRPSGAPSTIGRGCGSGLPVSDMKPTRSVEPPRPRVSGERGTLFSTLVHLWPYIWPGDRADLKLRVVAAMVLLLFAKLATIAVPFTYKWATDALAGQGNSSDASSWLAWVLLAPILMTVVYGGMRITMAVFSHMRDGVFAKVSMHAVRP